MNSVTADDEKAPDSAVTVRTENLSRVPRHVIEQARRDYAKDSEGVIDQRPKTRDECAEGIRPCPFVSCKYNLYLDVDERNGNIRYNHPGLEPDEVPGDSCVLDVAERRDATLEDLGEMFNLTRERIRQLEHKAIVKLRRSKHAVVAHESSELSDTMRVHTPKPLPPPPAPPPVATRPKPTLSLAPAPEPPMPLPAPALLPLDYVDQLLEDAPVDDDDEDEGEDEEDEVEESGLPELTERQHAILDAHVSLVNERGTVPPLFAVAVRARLQGGKNSVVATVSKALKDIAKKGYYIPRPTPVMPPTAEKEEPMPEKKDVPPVTTLKSEAAGEPAAGDDAQLRALLTKRREDHQKKIDAIDALLAQI